MSEKTITNQDNNAVVPVEDKVCENCHAKVQGMYCSQCGQSVESTLRYFWSVILHLLDDIFSFDSRASRTLFPLMFKPGFLTNEYIAGRRVHYVPPLRLYLFVSIVFFISLKFFAISPSIGGLNFSASNSTVNDVTKHIQKLEQQKANATTETIVTLNQSIEEFKQLQSDITDQPNAFIKGLATELIELKLDKINDGASFSEEEQQQIDRLKDKLTRMKKGEKFDLLEKGLSIANNEDGSLTLDFLSVENNKKLTQFAKLLTNKAEKAFTQDTTPLIREAIEKLPQLMFALLPIFAVLLKVMFIFSNRLYLEHLTVALHSHSFIFLSILLVELLEICQTYFKGSYLLISNASALLSTILLFWIPIYLFIMQKRVYKQGKFITVFKYIAISLIYIAMIGVTGIIAFIWGLANT